MNRDHLLIRALTLSYRSAGHLVRPVVDLDLAVHPGELVLLHGPSGCGKTTLLSAIAGLLTPDAGSIRVGDVEVSGLTGADLLAHRRRRVGMVFQSFNLLPSLTAVENVEAPLRLTGHGRRDSRARAVELLERFDMGHRLGHRPGMLSGGQQQRVAIARALAVDPPVVIADEPTAHLDHEQVDSVCATFRAIADTGRVVLIATHDDRLDPWADRRVAMSVGSPTARSVVDDVPDPRVRRLAALVPG